MLGNLQGWHLLVIIAVVVVVIAVMVAVVVVSSRRGRKRAAGSDDVSAKLEHLTQLRDRGQITDSEFEAKRQEIIGRL